MKLTDIAEKIIMAINELNIWGICRAVNHGKDFVYLNQIDKSHYTWKEKDKSKNLAKWEKEKAEHNLDQLKRLNKDDLYLYNTQTEEVK